MAANKKEAKEKPLDKMTAKELREVAQGIDQITGAHGMNKDELLKEIKAARGIADTQKNNRSSMRDIKAKIKRLKANRQQALTSGDAEQATMLRRRIARLKKQTRRA